MYGLCVILPLLIESQLLNLFSGFYQLVYSFQTLPDPPIAFIKQGEQAAFQVIWSSKPNKVKRNSMSAPIQSLESS